MSKQPSRLGNKPSAILVLMVTALLMQQIDRDTGAEPEKNPATLAIANLLGKWFRQMSETDKEKITFKVNRARRKLTNKTKDVPLHSGLVACIKVLVGESFLSTPGTEFDFIRTTFRKNLKEIVKLFPLDEGQSAMFERELLKAMDGTR